MPDEVVPVEVQDIEMLLHTLQTQILSSQRILETGKLDRELLEAGIACLENCRRYFLTYLLKIEAGGIKNRPEFVPPGGPGPGAGEGRHILSVHGSENGGFGQVRYTGPKVTKITPIRINENTMAIGIPQDVMERIEENSDQMESILESMYQDFKTGHDREFTRRVAINRIKDVLSITFEESEMLLYAIEHQ